MSRIQILGLVLVVTILTAGVCMGGMIGPGRHSGIVIFDRWDDCILYQGVYVMYVSKAVKDQLRAEAGKAVTLDAPKVFQPVNPGDALIEEFDVVPAADAEHGEPRSHLSLSTRADFEKGQRPAFVIQVQNLGASPEPLRFDSLAPTLLGEKAGLVDFGPSDGGSIAVVTRQSFWRGGIQKANLEGGGTWKWKVTKPAELPQYITLQPQERFEISLSFDLPEGRYDFLAGYMGSSVQGGPYVASRLIAFDVAKNGGATLVEVPGR